jgi:hypothetical protein
MKRFLFLEVLLGMGTAFGGPCLPGTLQSYIELGTGGCQIGDIFVSSFTTAPGQTFATPIDPLQVQLTPGGTFFNPNLMFTFNQAANATELFESLFGFNAAAAALTGASLSLNSANVSGDGAITGILDVCIGGTFPGIPLGCSGTPASAIAAEIAGLSVPAVPITTAAGFFDVFVDITIDGGLSGSAFLGSSTVSLASVPEPGVGLLVAVGLCVIGVLRVRRKSLDLPRRKACSSD